jgi:adenylate cyclase
VMMKSKFKIRLAFIEAAGKKSKFQTASDIIQVGRRLPPRPDHLGLEDDLVSSHHARITRESDGVYVEDLNSANGTWVDGKKIKTKTRLDPSSIVFIGRTTIHLETDASAPRPFEKKKAPEAVQTPLEVIAGDEPMPNLVLAEAAPDIARVRLTAICELSSVLSETDSVDTLCRVLLEHLHRAFPSFGRNAHSGFLMGSDLILKAYLPEADPPSCSLTLARHVLTQKKACLWRLGVPGEIDPSMSLMSAGATSAMYAPVMWSGEILGVVYFDATSAVTALDKDDLRLLQLMATQAAMFIKNLQLRQTLQRESDIKVRLLAQFPPSIADRLARLPDRAAIPSQRLETVTILISDVRGFTKLSSIMEPEEVVRMLNEMFYDLTPIILKHNGTVDKYIGDAVLAVFGSPEPDDEQGEHAVQAALEMQTAMKKLETTRWKGRTPFRIGIALHAGPAIHGFIGAPERMEYTVIGSTINIASRYCDAAAPGSILVSPFVYSRLHYCLEVEHPPIEVETKHEGVLKAYVVKGWKGTRGRPPA